jgi:hypothetical protein
MAGDKFWSTKSSPSAHNLRSHQLKWKKHMMATEKVSKGTAGESFLSTPPLKTDENVSFAPPKHRCRELLYNTGLILTATKIWKLSPCTFHHLSLQVNIHILLAKWTRLSPSETNLASKAFGDPHHGS